MSRPRLPQLPFEEAVDVLDLKAVDVLAEIVEVVAVVAVVAVVQVLLPTEFVVRRSQLSSPPQSPTLRGQRHGHLLRRERPPRRRSRVRDRLQQPQNP